MITSQKGEQVVSKFWRYSRTYSASHYGKRRLEKNYSWAESQRVIYHLKALV